MNWLGATALHHAAEGGHKDIVKLLINNAADIHHKNDGGKTMINWSIYLFIVLSIYIYF